MKVKLVIVMLVVLAIVSIVVVKLNKKELNPNDLSSAKNTVLVNDSMSDEVIEYKGVVIENISLSKDTKTLYFVISSNNLKEELPLSVVLLNNKREDSSNKKMMTLKNVKEEKNIKIDLESIYNEPEKIKFVIGE